MQTIAKEQKKLGTTIFYRNPESFLCWLSHDNGHDNEILEWVHFGFGSGRGTEDPHLQLFNAIPVGGDNYPTRRRLAARIASVLEQWPNVEQPLKAKPDTLLYELLSLAGRLNCPDLLFGPLFGIYQRLGQAIRPLPVVPPIGFALAKALMHNQLATDRRMLEVWLRMTEGKNENVLGGTPELGIEGIGMLPSRIDSEHPDTDVINQGLLNLAKSYQLDENRWGKFRDTVHWLTELWGLHPRYFVEMADTHQWLKTEQDWAIDALPRLFTNDTGKAPNNILTWCVFAICMHELVDDYEVEQVYCGGRILNIGFSTLKHPEAQLFLQRFEGLALRKNLSEREFHTGIIHITHEIAQHLNRKAPGTAKTIEDKVNEYFAGNAPKPSQHCA